MIRDTNNFTLIIYHGLSQFNYKLTQQFKHEINPSDDVNSNDLNVKSKRQELKMI